MTFGAKSRQVESLPGRRCCIERWSVVGVILTLAACSSSHPALPHLRGDRVHSAVSAAREPLVNAELELNDAQGRLSLARLLRYAAERNPQLNRVRELAAAARQRRPQVTALPDPMMRLGWYAEEVQTRTGPQQFAVGLSQAIPWPEKLSVAGAAADIEADQARVREWITGRDVLLAVTRHYRELHYIVKAERETAALEKLWSQLLARAAAAPQIASAEIARAEARLEQARFDRQMLKELAEIERQRLRSFIGAPRTSAIADPVSLVLPTLAASLEALHEAALQSNQELLLASLGWKLAKSREKLAELSLMPDFSVGGRYVRTGRRPDGVRPIGNGADPVVLELGIKLPLQRSAKHAAITEAHRRALSQAFARDGIAQELRADLTEAFYRARNEERLLRLHEETLVPQAEHAAREAEAVLERGGSGLAGLIETMAARHQVRLGALRARADYAIRLTRIEQLIGTPLERITPRATEENR